MSGKGSSDTDRPTGVQSSANWDGVGASLERWFVKWAATQGAENHLRSITLYPPKATKAGQWMVVGKAWSGGYKLVAFHRSTSGLRCLAGFFQRWWENKLEWKHDQFSD